MQIMRKLFDLIIEEVNCKTQHLHFSKCWETAKNCRGNLGVGNLIKMVLNERVGRQELGLRPFPKFGKSGKRGGGKSFFCCVLT